MTKLSLEIEGMTCGHCVGSVKRALQGLAGVDVEQVKVGSAVLSYDDQAVTRARITQVVEDEGYSIVAAR